MVYAIASLTYALVALFTFTWFLWTIPGSMSFTLTRKEALPHAACAGALWPLFWAVAASTKGEEWR